MLTVAENTVFERATRGAVFDIVQNMRDADRAEIFGLVPEQDPWDLAIETAQTGGVIAKRGREPIAVIAAQPIAPGWLEAWAFATDKWPLVALAATRYVRRYLIPSYLTAGISRVECRALADNQATGRWLRSCGAVPEAVMPDCGPNRLTFVLYAWRRSDFQVNLGGMHSPAPPLDSLGPGLLVKGNVPKSVLDAQSRYGTPFGADG